MKLEIASRSSVWELKMINLNNFNWSVDSDYDNPSKEAYPIITIDYEVLDGKHRIGMLNDKNYEEYPMWVG